MIPCIKRVLVYFLCISTLIILLNPCGTLKAQSKYGFDFERDWEWVDLLFNDLSSSEAISSAVKLLMNEYTIEEARILFRELIKLDSLNDLKRLPEIVRLDLKRNQEKWDTKIRIGLKDFNERNTFAGLISSAVTLSVIRRPFLFGGKSFKNREYISNILENVNLDVKLDYNYSGANEIIDLLEKETLPDDISDIIDNSELIQAILKPNNKNGITKDELIKCLKNSQLNEPLFVLYKLINPTSFYNFGGISLHIKDFRKLIGSIQYNEAKIKYEILSHLALYFPKDLSLTTEILFLLGNNGSHWKIADNKFGIDLEYIGDDYDYLVKLITRELYLDALRENQLNVYSYLVNPKDSLLLKVMTIVFTGGTANHIAAILQENRPAVLLEKDFLFFKKTFNAIKKRKKLTIIDSLINTGGSERGPFNTMGTQMANSIDKVLGRAALKKCLMLGPVCFFTHYIEAYEQDSKQIRHIFRFPSEIEDKIISLTQFFPEEIFKNVIKLKIYKSDSTQLINELKNLSEKYKKDKRFYIFNLLSGRLLYESGYYTNASEYYRKSLDGLPGKSKASKELGFLFLTKGAYIEALEMFNLYVQYSPDNSDAYESRGFLYYKISEFEKAKEDYEKALSIIPDLKSAKDMLDKINKELDES